MSAPKCHEGGPAFPVDSLDIPGMSLRDWFAGQVLAGIVVSLGVPDEHSAAEGHAIDAYRIADAGVADDDH